jgi:L-2-hydroxyglutarate oxidase
MNDFSIIGGGIVGLATAYHLRMRYPDAKMLVIEKESKPAFHQTGRNSGVIHSGIYYTPGSLKAVNCIRGYSMLLDFCQEHDIAHDICGKIIVAVRPEELPFLEKIYNNGVQNGLTGLQWLDADQIRDREPNIEGIRAIWVPQAGIINYGTVAGKLREILEASGVQFAFNRKVTGLEERADEVIIKTDNGEFRTLQLITCGGLYADKLAEMTGRQLDCRILPFRGEYYKFKEDRKHMVNHLVYPVPDPDFPFLGVHFTRMINGDVEAGPNAVLAFAREGYRFRQVHAGELMESLLYPGFRKLARKHLRKGLDEMKRSLSKAAFIRELQKMMPSLQPDDMVKAGAGVRAQVLNRDGSLMEDFYFEQSKRVLHVINAPSPAATSSLSIGNYIAEKVDVPRS